MPLRMEQHQEHLYHNNKENHAQQVFYGILLHIKYIV